MIEIIEQLPSTAIGWIGLIIAATAGGFVAYLYYNRQKDGADDRLINILKQTVDALETKVNKQSEDIEALTKKVNELERENDTLIEVLQGRDKNTLEFQKQMLDAMKIGMETNGLAKENSEKLAHLIDIMTEHLEVVRQHQEEEEA